MSIDEEFRRMVSDFANGKSDVIVMHIDTTKLLTKEEWELLKSAGGSVVVVNKEVPDNDA